MTLTLSPTHIPLAGYGIRSALSRIARPFGGMLQKMQCARLREAMTKLSDQQLSDIGLTRADIPRHAHACIYGAAE